ncbi:MAG: glycosyltransferase family A protein [Anaerolineales bacterium]
MTRYGMNPARNKNISYAPSRVTAAMMTFIPNLEGYFTHRLDVLKLSLESLIHSLNRQADIMILNNGSCDLVQEYLETLLEQGRIDYLIHSKRNLGVIGGLKVVFNAIPGQVIAYSDDDVLYYPEWLDAHLKILDSYPNVGLVSGAPVGYSSEGAFSAVDQFIFDTASDLQITEHPRVSEWEKDWAESTGRSIEDHLEKVIKTPNVHLIYRGVEAIRSSKHFQFITPKEIICQAFSPEWSGSLMDDLVSLDESVNQMGYLRLCTPTRYVRHIGNALTEDIVREAERLKIPVGIPVKELKEHVHWLLRIPGSGRILWPAYRWLFKILHHVR